MLKAVMTTNTPALPGTSDKSVLIPVQWLRAIAAIMVVVHHALYFTNTARGLPPEADRQLLGFSSWGYGIHLFFVISGFIMANSATGFGEPGAALSFLKRRLIRVVPLYWIVTTAFVLVVLIAPGAEAIAGSKLAYILGSYLFIPVLRVEGDLRPLVGQGWTLDYEMFFYVMFALGMLLPRRAAILGLTLAFLALSWAGRDLTVSSPILFTWTDGLILEFLFGVYVGLAYQAGWRLPRWAAVSVVGTGVALTLLELHGPTALIAGLPATFIIAGFTLGPQPDARSGPDWLARLGDASYSLYLTHTIVLRLLWRLWTAAGGGSWPPGCFAVVAIIVSAAASIVVYRRLERPLIRFLQRRWLSTEAKTRPPSTEFATIGAPCAGRR